MKKQTKLNAVRWCLHHMYQAEQKALAAQELPSYDGTDMEGFIAEIQRLTKPLEKRLLDLQREG